MNPNCQYLFKFGYLHNCHFHEKIIRRYSFDRLDVKFGDSKRLEEIIGIYETNKFNGGVGIQASRFNHSCCSNAEGVWNKQDGTREFRVVKKVKSGETPCY